LTPGYRRPISTSCFAWAAAPRRADLRRASRRDAFFSRIRISGRRFSWSGTVRVVNEPPTFILSAADWLTLVEIFGLAADVNDAARKG
jgi:hypothetical protein